MSEPRWRRLVPESSQLWLVALLLAVVFAGTSFINLANDKTRAQGKLQVLQTQVAQMEDQNSRLHASLAEAEMGGHVELEARERHGFVRPGETRVVAVGEPEVMPTPVPQRAQGGAPYWMDWWKRLTEF